MNLNVIAPTSSVYFLNNGMPMSAQAMNNRPYYNTAPMNQFWMQPPTYQMPYAPMMFYAPSYSPAQQFYQPVYPQMPLTWGYSG